MPNVFECRLANTVFQSNPVRWTTAKQVAIQGFNAGTCSNWDVSFASALVRADATAAGVFGECGCGVTEPANVASVYTVATRTGSIRCDVFQTNANLSATKRARLRAAADRQRRRAIRPGRAERGERSRPPTSWISTIRWAGFDGDGYAQAARHVADPDALRLTYEGGFVNGFNGRGSRTCRSSTQRDNASDTGNIHDTMQDLIIRARLLRANGRADNQIIWTSSAEAASAGVAVAWISLDVINAWLDNIAADPAPRLHRQGGAQQAGAGNRCLLGHERQSHRRDRVDQPGGHLQPDLSALQHAAPGDRRAARPGRDEMLSQAGRHGRLPRRGLFRPGGSRAPERDLPFRRMRLEPAQRGSGAGNRDSVVHVLGRSRLRAAGDPPGFQMIARVQSPSPSTRATP